MSIIDELAGIRRMKNISQQEMAQRVPCSTASIGRWERGEVPPPFDYLEKWCAALGYELTIKPRGEQ